MCARSEGRDSSAAPRVRRGCPREVRAGARGAALAAVAAAALVAGGCGAPSPGPSCAPIASAATKAGATLAPTALPGWAADDLDGLAAALARQCALAAAASAWPALCRDRPATGPALKAWIERRMLAEPLVADDGRPAGLITGYHEPELAGSRVRTSPAQVPLYRRPPDVIVSMRPARSAIEQGTLLAGHELAWVDDPVEAFFLQVQGSGRLRLRDGSVMRVGYAGDNGLPYHAIGRTLVDRGALSAGQVDAPAIKDWLRAHPADAAQVMRTNPRYVFFRELPPAGADEGPPGSLGVALTPLRSVAVDPARIAPGSLLYLATTHPADGRPLERVVVAQDTGAAIRGTVRADLFWGAGPQAALAAGTMKQAGRLWLLRLAP